MWKIDIQHEIFLLFYFMFSGNFSIRFGYTTQKCWLLGTLAKARAPNNQYFWVVYPLLICLSNRYCFPLVDFRLKKIPAEYETKLIILTIMRSVSGGCEWWSHMNTDVPCLSFHSLKLIPCMLWQLPSIFGSPSYMADNAIRSWRVLLALQVCINGINVIAW